jgi:hypothetical protein
MHEEAKLTQSPRGAQFFDVLLRGECPMKLIIALAAAGLVSVTAIIPANAQVQRSQTYIMRSQTYIMKCHLLAPIGACGLQVTGRAR